MNSENLSKGQVIVYKNNVEVRLEKETVWLSLNQMADLFGRDKSVISRHLRNIFKTKELDNGATVAFFATVQEEGGRIVERNIEYFNLDVIISVGYRVNSKQGTQFRIWATNVLRKHLVDGYTINEKRLKAAAHKYQELQKTLKLLATLFVCFLQKNGILLRNDGTKRIDDNALVALTLMIAVSKPQEKDSMIKVILNLLA
ncbi:MAG: virulence RhuM family protein [Planctomycetia bacterium]|nr:virulence RhuM family protein [Planctomycetia bacterium]